MANFKSTQVTQLDTDPPGRLHTTDYNGRQRFSYFDFEAPTGGLAANDTIELCEISAGARVIGGHLANEAGGAGRLLQIGIEGTVGKYSGTLDIATAGQKQFANTIALNYGSKAGTKERIIATLTGGTLAAGVKIRGHIAYVSD